MGDQALKSPADCSSFELQPPAFSPCLTLNLFYPLMARQQQEAMDQQVLMVVVAGIDAI